MIKKFSEHINEDYFSKLASRKETGNVRIENKVFGNIKDMEPFLFTSKSKFGYKLYLSDRILMNGNQKYFSPKDLENENLGEWRLPTYSDFQKLFVGVKFKNKTILKDGLRKEAVEFENGYTLCSYGFVRCGESTIIDNDNNLKRVHDNIYCETTVGEYLVLPDNDTDTFYILKFGAQFDGDEKSSKILPCARENVEKYKVSIILVKDVDDDKEVK